MGHSYGGLAEKCTQIGFSIQILGPHRVVLFGEVWKVQPCWRKCITRVILESKMPTSDSCTERGSDVIGQREEMRWPGQKGI